MGYSTGTATSYRSSADAGPCTDDLSQKVSFHAPQHCQRMMVLHQENRNIDTKHEMVLPKAQGSVLADGVTLQMAMTVKKNKNNNNKKIGHHARPRRASATAPLRTGADCTAQVPAGTHRWSCEVPCQTMFTGRALRASHRRKARVDSMPSAGALEKTERSSLRVSFI